MDVVTACKRKRVSLSDICEAERTGWRRGRAGGCRQEATGAGLLRVGVPFFLMSAGALRLPPELWLEIFSHTAWNLDRLYACSYEPFMLSGAALDRQRHTILKSFVSLALVCRQFQALVTPFLYEDVHIGKRFWNFNGQRAEEHSEQTVRRTHTSPFSMNCSRHLTLCM